MLEFATLFLSLVTGIHPVEVVVGEAVVSVEIVLDGESVGVIEGEPWKLECDFGRDPLPHELLAIARDESGRTVKTARQLVNLPKSQSELRLILLGAEGASPSAARLVIGSALFVEPENIAVGLDGTPLEFESPELIPLPKTDPSSHHIVTAEVEFTDGSTAHTAITFTQGASGATQAELTAVPIVVAGNAAPTIEFLQDSFRVNGEIVKVSTVERPGGRIFMVRDQNASEQLQEMGWFRDRRLSRSRRLEIWKGSRSIKGRGAEEALFRSVVPIPSQLEAHEASLEKSFWISPLFRIEEAGLGWCASHIFPRPSNLAGGAKNQQVAEALAIAGLKAAGSGRPRVVVLVVGDKKHDASLFGIEATKQFLRALNVPLVIWSTEPAAAQRWGGGTPVDSPKRISRAAKGVVEALDQQWIVWIEGLHVPGNITLDTTRGDLQFAAF